MRRLFLSLLGTTAFGLALFVFADDTTPPPKAAAKPSPAPVPVLAATAEAQDVPIILRGLGAVTAFNTVALRSRVEGAITEIRFKEGQFVKAGDLLIQLDARPFQASVDQAEGMLARDQAGLANAKIDLARYEDLLKRNFTPEKQVTTQKTLVSQDQAAVESDQAAVKSARLNLEYAALRSPISGVTGIRQIDIGNLIPANSTQTLVTITQIEPIYVIFTLPEADIDRVRQAMAEGPLKIEAYAPDDKRKISEGVLDLIDNSVDQTTGTVKLKAEFKNADRALWPGQFVNAHVVLRTIHDGVTVPSAAVLTGPDGTFAYVIDAKSRAAIRQVTVVQTEGNRALIGDGLKTGDKVVTAGQFRLQPNAEVQVGDAAAGLEQTLSDAPAGTEPSK